MDRPMNKSKLPLYIKSSSLSATNEPNSFKECHFFSKSLKSFRQSNWYIDCICSEFSAFVEWDKALVCIQQAATEHEQELAKVGSAAATMNKKKECCAMSR